MKSSETLFRLVSIIILSACAFWMTRQSTVACPWTVPHSPVGELVSGQTVSQEFRAEKDGLDGISIPIATYNRINDVSVHITIKRKVDNTILAERLLDCKNLVDNSSCRLLFPCERKSCFNGLRTPGLRCWMSWQNTASRSSLSMLSLGNISST